MNKGDIKATILLLACIISGSIGGYYLEQFNPNSNGLNAVWGFVLGVIAFFSLVAIWISIRLSIKD